MQPIDMVLHCPACGTQHIDTPALGWDNPPHRSHECQGVVVRNGKLAKCGCTWRPADVPTNGVQVVRTAGQRDWSAEQIEKAQPDETYAGYTIYQVLERLLGGTEDLMGAIELVRGWFDANIVNPEEFEEWMQNG